MTMTLLLMTTTNTHGCREARRGTFAQILILLLVCFGYKAQEAVATTIAEEDPISSQAVVAPRAKTSPNPMNVFGFGNQLRSRSTTEPKDYRSRDKTPSSTPNGAPSASQSRPKTPTPTPPQSSFPYEPKSSEPLVLKATGITMTLVGVDSLDKDSWLVWEKVTGKFIRSDIKTSLKEVDRLEVSILLVSQDPPLPEDSGQALTKSEAPRTLKEQKLTLDVDILIQSIAEVEDAEIFVANAFSSESKQTSYLQKLRGTGYPSFANVERMSVKVRPSLSRPSENEKMAIGIMGASMMAAVILLSIALLVMHRNMAHAKEHVVKKEDPTVDLQVRTDVDSNSSVNNQANGPSDEDQSHASVYWQGVIHASLSADTDLENTPRISHPRLLIAKSESSIDDNSLFTDDGFDRYMYSPGKVRKFDTRFEM